MTNVDARSPQDFDETTKSSLFADWVFGSVIILLPTQF